MQVVDAPSGHATQRSEAARVGIEQHLVALAGVGHQPERPAGAQLHVRHLQPVVDATHHQAFFAPIELEGLAELEVQRHEGPGHRTGAFSLAPGADEVGHAAVAAAVARGLDLGIQGPSRATLVFRAPSIGLQRLLDRLLERIELVRHLAAPVLRRTANLAVQPLGHRVARQPRHARNLPLALVAPAVQPPDPANHVHGDHSVPLLLKKAAG